MMNGTVLKAENLVCRREIARDEPSFVSGVTLEIPQGGHIVLAGEAGSGKLLLLHLFGLLERPDEGEIFLLGRGTAGMDEAVRSDLRNRHVGVLLNEPYLLPMLTVAENVAMPMFKILEIDTAAARQRTLSILDELCISHLQDTPAGGLGRFEQHIVAFARSLAVQPQIFIAEDGDPSFSAQESATWLRIVDQVAECHGLTLVRAAAPGSPSPPRARTVRMVRGQITEGLALAVPRSGK